MQESVSSTPHREASSAAVSSRLSKEGTLTASPQSAFHAFQRPIHIQSPPNHRSRWDALKPQNSAVVNGKDESKLGRRVKISQQLIQSNARIKRMQSSPWPEKMSKDASNRCKDDFDEVEDLEMASISSKCSVMFQDRPQLTVRHKAEPAVSDEDIRRCLMEGVVSAHYSRTGMQYYTLVLIKQLKEGQRMIPKERCNDKLLVKSDVEIVSVSLETIVYKLLRDFIRKTDVSVLEEGELPTLLDHLHIREVTTGLPLQQDCTEDDGGSRNAGLPSTSFIAAMCQDEMKVAHPKFADHFQLIQNFDEELTLFQITYWKELFDCLMDITLSNNDKTVADFARLLDNMKKDVCYDEKTIEKIVNWSVSRECGITFEASHGMTLLSRACYYSQLEIVQLLMDNQAQPWRLNRPSSNRLAPIHAMLSVERFAYVADRERDGDIIRLILQHPSITSKEGYQNALVHMPCNDQVIIQRAIISANQSAIDMLVNYKPYIAPEWRMMAVVGGMHLGDRYLFDGTMKTPIHQSIPSRYRTVQAHELPKSFYLQEVSTGQYVMLNSNWWHGDPRDHIDATLPGNLHLQSKSQDQKASFRVISDFAEGFLRLFVTNASQSEEDRQRVSPVMHCIGSCSRLTHLRVKRWESNTAIYERDKQYWRFYTEARHEKSLLKVVLGQSMNPLQESDEVKLHQGRFVFYDTNRDVLSSLNRDIQMACEFFVIPVDRKRENPYKKMLEMLEK